MVKVVVKGAQLELTPIGPWVWTPDGKKLKIQIDSADTKVSGNQSTAPLATAVLDAITSQVPGIDYHHLAAAQAGKVQSVDATLDGGTETSKLTAGGASLATAGTTGRFTICAGDPSKDYTAAGPVPDSVLVHSGTWRVIDPGQAVLSEAEHSGVRPGSGSSNSGQGTAVQAATSSRGNASKAQPGTALRLALSLGRPASAPSGAGGAPDEAGLLAIWGPELLREDLRLALEIVVAQPRDSGGFAGRFRRSTSAQSWLERRNDGSTDPSPRPLDVVLDAVALHPSKPVWLSIVARLERNGASLDTASIGLTAEFAPADQPIVVVAPPVAKGAARLILDAPDVARPENDVFGADESGRAQRLIEALPVTDGWVEFPDNPAPPAAGSRDWLRWRPAIVRRFSFIEAGDKSDGTRRRCEPLRLTLVPDSPGLLALRALAPVLRASNAALDLSMSDRLAQAGLALTLSSLLRGSAQIAESVREGLPDPFSVPDSLLGPFTDKDARDLHDRSGGFVRRLNAATADLISASDLFLLLHSADLRERGIALAESARPLFELICSSAIELEQQTAVQRAGVAALAWDETRAASPAEAEQIWLAEIARQLEPSCSAHSSATALASAIASSLGAIDAHLARIAGVLEQAETKGLLHAVLARSGRLLDSAAAPLLSPSMKAALDCALVRRGAFAALVRNAVFAPTAGQAPKLLAQVRDALKPGKDWTDGLDKLAKAMPAVHRYLHRPAAWHELEIQRIEQLVVVMSVAISKGSQETRLLVREVAMKISTLRIPRRGGATLETVEWVETRIVGRQNVTSAGGELGGAIPDGQSSVDVRAARARTTVETQTLHMRGGGLRDEQVQLGPNSKWPSRVGSLGDGFLAAFSAVNLLHRFQDDDAKDWVENGFAMAGDAAALLKLGMDHGGRLMGLSRVVEFAGARVNPLVALIDVVLSTYRLVFDWGEKPWWSTAGDFVAVLAALAAGAVVVIGVATAPLWLVVGSVVLSVIAIAFPDYVPEDIKAGLAHLKRLVEQGAFGRLRLPPRIGPQPRPLTTLMAGDHGGQVAVLPARRPSPEETAWLDRLTGMPDASSSQQAAALTLTTAAISAEIFPARLAIRPGGAAVGAGALWLPGSGQVHGVGIKVATALLLGAAEPIMIFPYGQDRGTCIRLKIRLNGAILSLRADLEGAAANARLWTWTAAEPRNTGPDENAPLGALLVMDNRDGGDVASSVDIPLVGATAAVVQLFVVARDMEPSTPELSFPAGDGTRLRRVQEHRRAPIFSVEQLSEGLVRVAKD